MWQRHGLRPSVFAEMSPQEQEFIIASEQLEDDAALNWQHATAENVGGIIKVLAKIFKK